jgi:hypothetical protein
MLRGGETVDREATPEPSAGGTTLPGLRDSGWILDPPRSLRDPAQGCGLGEPISVRIEEPGEGGGEASGPTAP